MKFKKKKVKRDSKKVIDNNKIMKVNKLEERKA